MNLAKATPVFIVDRIEPSLPFWCRGLGYTKRVEVPHGDALGFVILQGASGEVMLQTRASLAEDLPAVAARKPEVVYFLEVDSVSAALEVAKGAAVLVADRTTPYGTRESVVVAPGGLVVIFAEHAPK